MSEEMKWSKWFAGMIDPTAYLKTLAILLRAAFLVLVIACVVFCGLRLKSFILGKARESQKVVITGQQGGTVHNSTDEIRKKVGLLNIF